MSFWAIVLAVAVGAFLGGVAWGAVKSIIRAVWNTDSVADWREAKGRELLKQQRLIERVRQAKDALNMPMTLNMANTRFIRHDGVNNDLVVIGTRLPIWKVARRLQENTCFLKILEEFPTLPPNGLAAVVVYYDAHRADMDALIEERTKDA